MILENYSRVRMLTDAYQSENVHIGMVGYVIETYPDNHHEIEFSNEDGITVAQIVTRGDEIELYPEEVEQLVVGGIAKGG